LLGIGWAIRVIPSSEQAILFGIDSTDQSEISMQQRSAKGRELGMALALALGLAFALFGVAILAASYLAK
jgi:hypothetical protein